MKKLAIVAAVLGTAACVPPAAQPTDCQTAIRVAFAGTGVAERMVAISWRESRWTPAVVNRSGHVGCLQLSRLHRARAARLGFGRADMRRAWPNALVARTLYDTAGLSPWASTK